MISCYISFLFIVISESVISHSVISISFFWLYQIPLHQILLYQFPFSGYISFRYIRVRYINFLFLLHQIPLYQFPGKMLHHIPLYQIPLYQLPHPPPEPSRPSSLPPSLPRRVIHRWEVFRCGASHMLWRRKKGKQAWAIAQPATCRPRPPPRPRPGLHEHACLIGSPRDHRAAAVRSRSYSASTDKYCANVHTAVLRLNSGSTQTQTRTIIPFVSCKE